MAALQCRLAVLVFAAGVIDSADGGGVRRPSLLFVSGQPLTYRAGDALPSADSNSTETSTIYHRKEKRRGYMQDPLLVRQRHFEAELARSEQKRRGVVFFVTLHLIFGALLVVFCVGCLSAMRAAASERSEASPHGGEQGVGLYGHFFLRHKNKAFSEDFELVARGAFFALLVGLPFLVPKGMIAFVDEAVENGTYTAMAVVYFILVFYKTVGETVYFARCAILGTAIAALNCAVACWLFPRGVRDYTHHSFFGHTFVFWFGLLHGVSFVWFSFWLNMERLTVIFSLVTFLWFWMEFMRPVGPAIDFQGTARGALLECLVGCALAVLAALVPRPMWAMTRAQSAATAAAVEIAVTWRTFVEDVCGGVWTLERQENIMANLQDLDENVAAISGHVRSGWYECFGVGRSNQSRKMLTELAALVRDSHDTLQGTVAALVAPRRSELLQSLKPHAKRLVDEANKLGSLSVEAACAGHMSDEEAQKISAGSARVEQATRGLTQQFEEVTKEWSGISQELLNEHIFCFAMCTFGRYTTSYAAAILADRDGTAPLDNAASSNWLAHLGGTYDRGVVLSLDNSVLAFKDAFTILLGFAVGYHGYMQLFDEYNASIASAMALSLLVCPYASSAVVNSVGRIQGAVFGLLIGHAAFSVFSWWGWWGYPGVAVTLASVAYLGLFLRFNSVTVYSTVGCLTAAFSAMALLRGCMLQPEHFRPTRHYSDIIGISVALILMVAIDLVFARSRVSDDAYESLVAALKAIRGGVLHLFNPKQPRSRLHSGDIQAAISHAARLGREAAREPRFWRAEWNQGLFQKCTLSLSRMRFSLSIAEMSTAEQGHSGALKTQTLLNLLDMPSFARVSALLGDKLGALQDLLGVFQHEPPDEVEDFLEDPEAQGEEDLVAEWTAELQRFLAEVARAGLFKGNPSATSVEQDPPAQLSVVFASTTAIMVEVNSLRNTILRVGKKGRG